MNPSRSRPDIGVLKACSADFIVLSFFVLPFSLEIKFGLQFLRRMPHLPAISQLYHSLVDIMHLELLSLVFL